MASLSINSERGKSLLNLDFRYSLLFAIVSAFAGSAYSQLPSAYHYTQLGFQSGENQSSAGEFLGYASRLNSNGQVTGVSRRYTDTTNNGNTAWMADQSGTSRVGFYGVGYERETDGYSSSIIYGLNANGYAYGFSDRYVGGDSHGRVMWIDNGAGPVEVGLSGVGYENSDTGYRYSFLSTTYALNSNPPINSSNQTIGYTTRFNGNQDIGRAAWIDDGTGARRLGLFGPEFARSTDGYERTDVYSINNLGYTIGNTERYSNGEYAGRAAWIDRGSGATRLGFIGPDYTRASDNEQDSFTIAMNEAGHVLGASSPYNEINDIGRVTWIDTGTGPRRLGFQGPDYLSRGEYHYTGSELINNSGHTAGATVQYVNNHPDGYIAWADYGSGPIKIGLYGDQYSGVNRQLGYNQPTHINESGHVLGYAQYFVEGVSNPVGQELWFFDGVSSGQFGLTNGAYVRDSDQLRYSEVLVVEVTKTGPPELLVWSHSKGSDDARQATHDGAEDSDFA